MPRRPLARAVTSASATPHAQSPALPSSATVSPELLLLRRQWKWAAFGQFFFTFAPLFNMSDVTITDIEDDLTRSTGVILPRIMQRLLYTLSYDRKVNLDNWQTVLRKQYFKRNPEANPIGPEPLHPSQQDSSPAPETQDDIAVEAPGSEANAEVVVGTSENDGLKEERADEKVPEQQTSKSPSGHHEQESPPASKPESTQALEESKDWLDLPMLEKLDSMHLLTEWQFHNPQRVRTLMKDDDEGAAWRIEPIGYDAKSNAYWLIGADRLWIQRSPPKPSHQKKRKRPTSGDTDDPKAKRAAHHRSTTTATKGGRTSSSQSSSAQPQASRGSGRAAKAQAKMKLDAQAKELANFQRQAASAGKTKGKTPLPPPRGTRLSKRLRGAVEEEEWQPVPEEWLENHSSPSCTQHEHPVPKTGLESDDDSALTSLSDDEEHESQAEMVEEINQVKMDASDQVDHRDVEITSRTPNDFVEWETITVTLHEWEHVAEPFEKATHYTEKALYSVLTVDITPVIVAELKEIARQHQLEEAMVHRKRSSRIAIKESEREEAQLTAQRKAEEAEKMSRAQRLEARQQREEAERIKRETAREQRRKEREQREARNSRKTTDQRQDISVDVVGQSVSLNPSHTNGTHTDRPRQVNGSTNGSVSGSRTPDWELDCEICLRRGVNQDDGQPMMSCGLCNKWQHINCHDHADYAAGRRRRNWAVEEFICQRCRSRTASALPQHLTKSKPQHVGQHHSIGQVPYVQSDVSGRQYGAPSSFPPSSPLGQNGHRTYGAPVPPVLASQRHYQPPSSITFAHYQPDPQGFSNRQTYQRDHQVSPHGYTQHQAYTATIPQQVHPMQPSVLQGQLPQYANGGWPQQGHALHNGSYPEHQPPNPTEWQMPSAPADLRALPANYYPQHPPGPATDPAPYHMSR